MSADDGPGAGATLEVDTDAVSVGATAVAAEAASVYVVDWESAPDLQPILDSVHLAVARFPAGWQPPLELSGFVAVIHDADETTLVCAEALLASLGEPAPSEVELGWRRITFPGPLP